MISKKNTLILILGVFLVGCVNIKKKEESLPISLWIDKVKFVWRELPNSRTQCTDFDYFPNGGIRNFYCHIKDYSNPLELEKYFGKSIFKSGPHREGFLILNHSHEFGYYDPEFPKFLTKTLIPGANDKTFHFLTQPIYDKFIRNLSRTMYVTYQKLHSNEVFLTKERLRYKKLIEQKTLEPYYYEKFYSFMDYGFTDDPNPNIASHFKIFRDDPEFDGNVVKTCVAFWIRRSIDGTDVNFFEGLKLLLLTYDSEFIKRR
ncbi:hypothetical protein [Leptospira sp. GIMC2001]|uniref:hypothetical protein n=1 Tax=Leptospira sp. GIMC2001 TaxID=1513297 RepID=UPI002349616C|nr:hypothetical protein [Leptospira sp. GIMC2001]WCL49444.1 hypothetical protein O4O04_19470 [Leptospira sp. GIMC2001]